MGKLKILTLAENKTLSKIVNFITNPCTMLYSAVCSEQVLTNGEVFLMLGTVSGVYLVLILLSRFIPPLLRVPKEQTGQYRFMMIFTNCAFVGIPVVSAVFGPQGVFCVAIFTMVFCAVVYTYGACLVRGDTHFNFRDLLSPMFIAAVLSLIGYLLRIRLTGIPETVLGMLNGVTSPLAMIVTGCALSAVPLGKVFGNWRLYIVAFLKMIVIPVCALFVLRYVLQNPLALGVTVCLIGMPIAMNFTLLSAQYGRDQTLASSSIFLTTLLSVFTIPVLCSFLI
ncbi:MAG: AEC family transporter [Oscillospiraceae bacterium]|nr:AEC family transporter [Oscillospiraceae bacterium]